MSTYLTLSTRDAVMMAGVRLPGILTDLQVSGTLEITQQSLSGTQTLTSIQGYSTCKVTLQITILGTDQEREDQLRAINKAFYVDPPAVATAPASGGNVTAAAAPVQNAASFRIVNPHLDARRIRNVLLTKFDSRDGNEDDSTLVTLEFSEILAEMQRLQMAAQQQAAASGGTPVSLPASLGGGSGQATPTDATPSAPAPVSGFLAGVGGKPATPP